MITVVLVLSTLLTGFGAGMLFAKTGYGKAHKLGMTRGQLLQIAYMIDQRAYRMRLFEWMDTEAAYVWADAINKANPHVKAVPLEQE